MLSQVHRRKHELRRLLGMGNGRAEEDARSRDESQPHDTALTPHDTTGRRSPLPSRTLPAQASRWESRKPRDNRGQMLVTPQGVDRLGQPFWRASMICACVTTEALRANVLVQP